MSSRPRKQRTSVEMGSKMTRGQREIEGNRLLRMISANEPPRDKTNKVSVRPAKTQISLGIRPA